MHHADHRARRVQHGRVAADLTYAPIPTTHQQIGSGTRRPAGCARTFASGARPFSDTNRSSRDRHGSPFPGAHPDPWRTKLGRCPLFASWPPRRRQRRCGGGLSPGKPLSSFAIVQGHVKGEMNHVCIHWYTKGTDNSFWGDDSWPCPDRDLSGHGCRIA